MRNHHSIYLALMGGLGTVLLLSGCPKKVETTKAAAPVQEQAPAPAPEPSNPEPAPPPKVEETPVAKPAEMPSQGLADAYFDFDKYNIRDDARAALENDARWLKENPKVRVKIEGHCDERGTNEYNLALGERRAKAVRQVLTTLGVEAARLSTISYGEERPVCTQHDETCYAKNRRAHFTVQ
ncbi:MAG TPA: peptidoglycan-associated lipoprotein Pal [Nitrospiria bacterium]|nr:peptidoglycan-associated lipoprotein Pal [Nitrospiria bacterium]